MSEQYIPLRIKTVDGHSFVRIGQVWYFLPTVKQLQKRLSRALRNKRNVTEDDCTTQVLWSFLATERQFGKKLYGSRRRRSRRSKAPTMIFTNLPGQKLLRPSCGALLDSVKAAGGDRSFPKQIAGRVIVDLIGSSRAES